MKIHRTPHFVSRDEAECLAAKRRAIVAASTPQTIEAFDRSTARKRVGLIHVTC